MIDIQQALYNVLHSRYGRDVRDSIHDAIYQINENANEAVQTAKAMGVGTAVNSTTSSSAGFVPGNLYLNNQTWDLWQCIGTNSWLLKGNVKGVKGDKGSDGISNYIFIRYSQYYDGTDFTATPTASSQYLGIYYGVSAAAPTNKQDYIWSPYVGSAGTSAYLHIKYSEYADGTNFVEAPTSLTKYIGFYAGTSSTAPANKAAYVWSNYVGKDGLGSGNMNTDDFAPQATQQGLAGTVDRALMALSANNATDSTNALNLKKGNGQIVSVDEITAKLSDIDDKITKPSTATEGQVLTYKNNEWVADDAKGGIDEPTELEKGIVGGDEWTQRTYIVGETCIHNNKVWWCILDTNTEPSESDIHWKVLSLKSINSSLEPLEINCTPLGKCVNNTTEIKATKVGKTVFLTGMIGFNSAPSAGESMFKLPFIPNQRLRLMVYDNNEPIKAHLIINKSDDFSIFTVGSAIGSTSLLYINSFYMTDD